MTHPDSTAEPRADDSAPVELNPLLQILAAIQETNALLRLLTSHAPARQNPATYQTIAAKDRV